MEADWKVAPVECEQAGGVLSGQRIEELIERYEDEPHKQLIKHYSKNNLRAARYDVRIARDGMRPPGRAWQKPGEGGIKGPLILSPGDSAWVTTYEEFCMPPNLAGTVTLKTHLAKQGLLLLSGALIDPSYGAPPTPKDQQEDPTSSEHPGERRLRFFVANIGTFEIVLEPEVTPFASVQFFLVTDEDKGDRRPRPERDAPETGLGFIEKLAKVERQSTRLAEDVERTRDLMRNLIFLGYFVLAATILGVSLASILSAATDKKLVDALKDAIPDKASGKILAGVIVIGVAWIIYSIALMVSRGGSVAEEVARDKPDRRTQAVEVLERRTRVELVAFLVFMGVVVSVVTWVVVRWVPGRVWSWGWPLAVIVAGALLGVLAWGMSDLRQPFTNEQVDAEMKRILEPDEGPELSALRKLASRIRSLRPNQQSGVKTDAEEETPEAPSS